MTTTHRPIYKIAAEILRLWKNPYFGAIPYIAAMEQLETVQDSYYEDKAESIVIYFLSNATRWKGPDAVRIKAELKAMLPKR
jgi:hypothetical protein